MAITGSRSDWLPASVRLVWRNRAKTDISADAPKPNVMICKNHECAVMNDKIINTMLNPARILIFDTWALDINRAYVVFGRKTVKSADIRRQRKRRPGTRRNRAAQHNLNFIHLLARGTGR
ncbi:hypothetical protein GCM10007173_00650 [Glutamicibacter ardleyensis]|uniref:Uncharacterized protein n=1 Tax=Glutamicibacter ardleyensis TaxID=225894 RepID=A0ABQ2D4Q6_9MICC|nr:hypothetical protein GCM10007173_00650 [Glutamicibacter ardleyensis]